MNHLCRAYLIFLFILSGTISFSQEDSWNKRGTIKVAKAKDGEVYIKAIANFNKYNLSELRVDVTNDSKFQPFPVVEGYPYPFNYTRYFNDCFSTKQFDLKGKSADTVVMEVLVLENGKVYIKDKSKTMIVKGVPAIFDEKTGAYELNSLHLNCLNFLKKIDKWIPGYVILPKKGKFKGEVVVKPNKKNVDVTGTVTIIFSSTPFEE